MHSHQAQQVVGANNKGLSDEQELKRKGRSSDQRASSWKTRVPDSSVTGPGTEAKRTNVHTTNVCVSSHHYTVALYVHEVGTMNEATGLLLSPSKDWENSYWCALNKSLQIVDIFNITHLVLAPVNQAKRTVFSASQITVSPHGCLTTWWVRSGTQTFRTVQHNLNARKRTRNPDGNIMIGAYYKPLGAIY